MDYHYQVLIGAVTGFKIRPHSVKQQTYRVVTQDAASVNRSLFL